MIENLIYYLKYFSEIRDISTWSERMRAPMIELYGEDYFKENWSNWIDAMKIIFEKKNGDLCKGDLSKIKCPTLIVHGEKDAMVLKEHPLFLKENIDKSR